MRTKEVNLDGLKFTLGNLTQGDVVKIDNESRKFNPRGGTYVDERLYELEYVTAAIKNWTFCDDKKEVYKVDKEHVGLLPPYVFLELLDEATKLNMTQKQLDFLAKLEKEQK